MNSPIKLPKNTAFLSVLAATLLTLASFGSAHAVLLAYDGFAYTAGESIIGQNGGTGWTVAWAGNPSTTVIREISSTSITYNLNGFTYGGGNSLMIGGSNLTRVADRSVITTGVTTGQDIYFSYIFQAQGATGDLASGAFTGWYTRDSTGINTTTGNAFLSGNLQKVSARTAGTTTSGTSILQYGTTYLMVGRISGWDGTSYKTTSVWLNPDLDDLGTPTATATSATGGIGAFVGTVLRLNGLEASGSTFYFDDMRVGTTWDAVVIPEPGVSTLLALTGLGLLVFRWRSAAHRLS